MTFQFDPSIDLTLVATLTAAEGDEQFGYKDSLGILTIARGRCIDSRFPGTGLSEDERCYLLQNDIKKATAELLALFPWAAHLDKARFRAMVEIVFVLEHRITEFPKFIAAMRASQYAAAAGELLNSQWHAEAPSRVERIAHTIATGDTP